MTDIMTNYRESWRRAIYDATGDSVKTQRAMGLAELNGLFDPIAAQAAAPGGVVEPTADRLVDWVYLHATEGQQWPSTKTKSMLIARAMAGEPTQDHADGMKAVAPAAAQPQVREALDKAEQRLNETGGTDTMALVDTIHAVAALIREARAALTSENARRAK